MSIEVHHGFSEAQLRKAQSILAARAGRKGAATQSHAHRVAAGRKGGLAKAAARVWRVGDVYQTPKGKRHVVRDVSAGGFGTVDGIPYALHTIPAGWRKLRRDRARALVGRATT